MIPEKVMFTGLTINPLNILHRRYVMGTIDPNWSRVKFDLGHESYISLDRINRWIGANINGRWASYMLSLSFDLHIVVVAFEDDVDAVLFKLKDGDSAWRNSSDD